MKTAQENTEIITNEDIEVIEFTNIEALEQLYGKFSPQLFVAWGKLYKASLFNDITYPYGRIHEDDFTTYKVLYKAKKTVLTTEKLLYYWQRSDSIMGSGFKPKNVLDLLDAYEERAIFLHENNLTDLLSETYKSIFFIYIRIYLELYKFLPVISKEEFVDRFTDFKVQLRASKQSNSFKLTYELFSSFPILFKGVYKLIHLFKVDRLLMGMH
ncbi:hypothetical protein SDC9_125359 [bioreactor metagenome]|uniref:Uncharacterized protein n=1 Tax=bioreactor metagenome TaxID=1076179 RepID=A0A645CN65_9ZZZZ